MRYEANIAHVELPDRILQLRRAADTTSHDSDGRSTLYERGDRATLVLPEATHEACLLDLGTETATDDRPAEAPNQTALCAPAPRLDCGPTVMQLRRQRGAAVTRSR